MMMMMMINIIILLMLWSYNINFEKYLLSALYIGLKELWYFIRTKSHRYYVRLNFLFPGAKY